MGGKPDKLKRVVHITVYRTEKLEEDEEVVEGGVIGDGVEEVSIVLVVYPSGTVSLFQNWQMTKHPDSTRCRQTHSSLSAMQTLHTFSPSSTNTGKEKPTSQNGMKGNSCQYQKAETSLTQTSGEE